ncbi:ROK family protein [Dolosicoccus paucivorans]|uniref:ROK family protein n=1 Tax=Dolosicoccus paucivorans TaxID=84521 RepID=A0A1G8MQ73_9LACT|nr:ROK family protein [Dolosicoccus paucivorans]PMB85153.1 ROK family protein [Dolosicoccus paucivorans]PMC58955.1 ROK family protein [Dolosicoccus paucivorans]SDI70007.1 Sugar kinase of the NBD/HSP70 family, may contain an N-terminal HTH domain [Dolosicoccus paucivorans]
MNILAIDIGGTTIKSDVYCNDKSLGQFNEMPTQVDLNTQTNNILNQVEQLISHTIEELSLQNKQLSGVAIATAGVVDSSQGTVVYAGYTIPNYGGTDFSSMIQEQFDLPCVVLNDVNSATYAEYKLNDYNKEDTLLCLTIGTGIGSGIVIHNNLLIGHTFSAGEVGYMPIEGQKYQNIASTTALVKNYQSVLNSKEPVNGKMIFEAYHHNNSKAVHVVREWIQQLVKGLLPMVYILNPTTIALGGGVMAQHEVLIPLIKDELRHQLESEAFMPKSIKPMNVGNEAGRLGAYYYFLDHVSSK